MGFGPLAQNAGTAWVAAGRVLMYARTSTYICMDGCLYCMDGCLAIYCMDGYLYIAWTGDYILHGRVLLLHEQ